MHLPTQVVLPRPKTNNAIAAIERARRRGSAALIHPLAETYE
jgi:hypothetical protein